MRKANAAKEQLHKLELAKQEFKQTNEKWDN
jgi:hypothetical protein